LVASVAVAIAIATAVSFVSASTSTAATVGGTANTAGGVCGGIEGFFAGASAARGWTVFVLVFGFAFRDGVDVRARTEAPIWISRTVLSLGLYGTLLPQFAFSGWERLPYDTYVQGMACQTQDERRGGWRRPTYR
jgi:hypothetical protein